MRKVAIFVEGLTEVELLVRLIDHLCVGRHFVVEHHEQFGGQMTPVRASPIPPVPGQEIHIQILNCCNDGQVPTQIRDRYLGLVSAGFSYILGLRDLYPTHTAANVPQLIQRLGAAMPQGTVPIEFHFPELETEAWFLDEHSHFPRIKSALTMARILASGIDIASVPGHDWTHPAATLNSIYQLERVTYSKRGRRIRRTVNALSIAEMMNVGRQRSPSLNRFISSLETALF